MTARWDDLFDRAAAYEVPLEAIRDEHGTIRDEDEGADGGEDG